MLTEGRQSYHGVVALGYRGYGHGQTVGSRAGHVGHVAAENPGAGADERFAVSQRLKQVSGDLLQVSDGSLCPALHELEQEGLD